jgi:hypothetical protein
MLLSLLQRNVARAKCFVDSWNYVGTLFTFLLHMPDTSVDATVAVYPKNQLEPNLDQFGSAWLIPNQPPTTGQTYSHRNCFTY